MASDTGGDEEAGGDAGASGGEAGASARPEAPASDESAERPKAEYTDPSYWESRFQESDGVFDWYATYKELQDVFAEFCPPTSEPKVLMVGCGNSALSSEMHEAGFQRIVNIDISAAAVEKMANKFQHLDLEWREMDATAMTFEPDCFDLAVDKGTVDAMMAGGARTENEDGSQAAAPAPVLAAEVWRVLRPGGLFLLISHNRRRLQMLEEGVQAAHGDSATWQRLTIRRCRLSPQATLINILRSKLQGRPLAEAFKDPVLLQEAATETREAIRKMRILEAFRAFKARKARAAAAERQKAGEEVDGGAAEASILQERDDVEEEEEGNFESG